MNIKPKRRVKVCLWLVVFLLTAQISSPVLFQVATKRTQAGGSSDSWLTFHHDVGRSGYTLGSIPHSPSVLWKFKTSGPILSSPLVSNGTVYVASTDGHTYALNSTTGRLIWSSQQGTGGAGHSSPAIYQNSMYVPTGNYVTRLSLSDGKTVWRFQVPAEYGLINYDSLLVADGQICAPTNNVPGSVFCINPTDGSLTWNRTIWEVYGEIAYSNGLIFLGASLRYPLGFWHVIALNASTGGVAWDVNVGNAVFAGPTVVAGVLYIGGDTGDNGGRSPFYALNASTQAALWVRANTTGFEAPAVAYGRLYLSQISGIEALNQTDGAFLWSVLFNIGYSNGNPTFSDPVVADGLVIGGGGSIDPTLYAFDALTGKLVWSLLLGGSVDASPAIADGVVYVGASDGVLYAIGTSPQPSYLLQYVLLSGIAGGTIVIGTIFLLKRKRRI